MKIYFLPVFLISCLMKPPLEEIKPNKGSWTSGIFFSGHEHITRFAIIKANALIKSKHGLSSFYSEVSEWDSGWRTDNPLIEGNYKTDFPDKRIYDFYGVKKRDLRSWHSEPSFQNIHSMRNYSDEYTQTFFESCHSIKDSIIKATLKAFSFFRKGQKEEGLFWIGHASHIIQDSFSRAHSLRSPPSFKEIEDICTYGKRFESICFHKNYEDIIHGDRIWKVDLNCNLNPFEKNYSCLKPEAQAAVLATSGYLFIVGELVEEKKFLELGVEKAVKKVLEEEESPNGAYFGC